MVIYEILFAGVVWTWGKGDYFRLGHGADQHVRKPTIVESLRGKKIIHVAVGALHCLAVTDTGHVYAWGDNDHGQQVSTNQNTACHNMLTNHIAGIRQHLCQQEASSGPGSRLSQSVPSGLWLLSLHLLDHSGINQSEHNTP